MTQSALNSTCKDSLLAKKSRIVINPGRPDINPTFQYSGKVFCANEEILERSITCITNWINNKYPRKITFPHDQQYSYDDTQYGQSFSCIKLSEPTVWTCRLIQPDAPFRERSAVPGRNWITEISLALIDNTLLTYTKILCSSLPYGKAPIAYTRPRFLLDLSEFVNFDDIIPLSNTPYHVNTDETYSTFKDLLFNASRTLPILVATQPDPNKFTIPVSEYLVDTDSLAKKLKFSAHVVTLQNQYAFKLIEDIGKEWSVFGGAVRIYWPNINIDNSRPYDNDLYLPNKIFFWKTEDAISEKAFELYVHDHIFNYNSQINFEDLGQPLFHDAKLEYDVRLKKSISSTDNLIENHEKTISGLKLKIEKLEEDLHEVWGLAKTFQTERDEFKSDLEKSNYLIENLKHHLEQSSGDSFEDSVQPLDSYEKMSDWVIKNLSDRLELHPRAVRALKTAKYLDVKTVYLVLKILAFQYYNMQTGIPGSKDKFNASLSELSAEYRQSITTSRSGEEGDEYFVEYPIGSKKKVFIKWHIRKGTAHDDQYCLGVYFFWDTLKSKTIVCWLPSHLNNRCT